MENHERLKDGLIIHVKWSEFCSCFNECVVGSFDGSLYKSRFNVRISLVIMFVIVSLPSTIYINNLQTFSALNGL